MTNAELIAAIRARGEKSTEFNYGIRTADAYVRTLSECVGSDICYRYAATKSTSFDDIMRKAANTLTYSNDEMVLEEKATDVYAEGKLPDGIELPKNTLMVFRHVLTTPRKDRDGDILRTQGAELDKKMLLLWQHVHTLPIGKYLGTAVHNSKTLSVYSAIIDMNELCHDSAVMVDNDMGRFSHGFRALEFNKLKDDGPGQSSEKGGFDVTRFEVMEESLVSVPSNASAETEEVIMSLVSGRKLTSPIMKRIGQRIREKSAMSIPVKIDLQLSLNGKNIDGQSTIAIGGDKGCTCDGTPKEADGKAAGQEDADDKEMICKCGGKIKDGVCEKCGAKAAKAKKSDTCPKCGGPLDADGVCDECGDDTKAAVDQSEAGADNDMGVVMCPACGTVALVDGKCPKCGSTPTGVPKSYDGTRRINVDAKGYVSGSSLTGSWENVQSGLYEKVSGFVKQNGVSLGTPENGPMGYAYLLATYEGSAIIAVNDPNGQTSYYRAEWKQSDGEVKFVGTLKEIKIRTETSIIEKAVGFAKRLYGAAEKAGRALSSKNRALIEEARDGINEVDEKELLLSKGGRALCRQSKQKLEDVIKSSDPVEAEVGDITAKDAMAEFLSKATSDERSRMLNAINTLNAIEEKDVRTKKIRALVGR